MENRQGQRHPPVCLRIPQSLAYGAKKSANALWIWHTHSGDIIPTRCSFQMSICAECHQLNRILIQRDIRKRQSKAVLTNGI